MNGVLLTAVAATSTGDFTVVFLGTSKGHLKKVNSCFLFLSSDFLTLIVLYWLVRTAHSIKRVKCWWASRHRLWFILHRSRCYWHGTSRVFCCCCCSVSVRVVSLSLFFYFIFVWMSNEWMNEWMNECMCISVLWRGVVRLGSLTQVEPFSSLCGRLVSNRCTYNCPTWEGKARQVKE